MPKTTLEMILRQDFTGATVILDTIPKGADVQVIETGRKWSKVAYKGQEGYIASAYIEGNTPEKLAQLPSQERFTRTMGVPMVQPVIPEPVPVPVPPVNVGPTLPEIRTAVVSKELEDIEVLSPPSVPASLEELESTQDSEESEDNEDSEEENDTTAYSKHKRRLQRK